MALPKLEEGAAFAGISLTVLATLNLYKDTAPSLADVRSAPPGDIPTAQLLLDADILGLIVVVLLGGAGSVLVRRWYPMVLAGCALALVSAYYRRVYRSSNIAMRLGRVSDDG